MLKQDIVKAELAAVAVRPDQYPTDGKNEFAFVGKSNVGKSSLINSLANRKALARTSQSPGKTRTINFFNIDDELYFVDLPGYGYAKITRAESEKWGRMVEEYLKNRRCLKKIIFLIDIRHEPSANDKMMYEWLKYFNFGIISVATKADKLKRSQIAGSLARIKKSLGIGADDIILPFSSLSKDGRDGLWAEIEFANQT